MSRKNKANFKKTDNFHFYRNKELLTCIQVLQMKPTIKLLSIVYTQMQ